MWTSTFKMIQIRFILAAMLLVLLVEARYDEENESEQPQKPIAEPFIKTLQLSNEKLNLQPELDNKENEQNAGQRQKRWNSFYNDGFPFNPPGPFFVKRDGAQETGVYGTQDPFQQIYSQLQEIASFVRQPSYPVPTPPQLPVYLPFPFLYYPQSECRCITDKEPEPAATTAAPVLTTAPSVLNRFPEMEDPRQNWGPVETNVINKPEEPSSDDYEDEDPLRPISFTPIKPDTPLKRPVPGVAHGSSQASNSTTDAPIFAPASGPSQGQAPAFAPDFASPSTMAPVLPPTTCDVAVLKCCHSKQVTYQCFNAEGCANGFAGNPCDAAIITTVIDVFQRYYAQRTG